MTPNIPILDDSTPNDVWFDPRFERGAEPRDFTADPVEMFADPAGMPLYEEHEWDALIKQQDETESSLWHIWKRGQPGVKYMPLNQSKWGYCWNHSVVHTAMMARARDNQPYVELSAFAGAAIIKGGRNQGGWCGLGGKFARDVGIPSQKFFPQGQTDIRRYDTPEMRADAAKHRITEDYVDLARPLYSQNLTFKQVASCLLMNIPVAVDFSWWGHSVCAVKLVRVEAGSYGLMILNSWYVGQNTPWGDEGFAVLRGSKAMPDGAIATRATAASAA